MKIDKYNFGRMVIDGKEYTEDLIIYGDVIITNWKRENGHILTNEDLNIFWDKIGRYKGAIDSLVVGTGESSQMILSDDEANKMLDIVKLYVTQASTDQAVEEFNEREELGCNQAGVFHLTC